MPGRDYPTNLARQRASKWAGSSCVARQAPVAWRHSASLKSRRLRCDTTPRTLVQGARSGSLCDLNREPLGLRQLSSTTKIFACDYDLARAPRRAYRRLCCRPARHRTREMNEKGRGMTELSAHVPETLWEDGEFVLSRAAPDGEQSSILAATPLTTPPSPAAIARLQHAFKLRNELDPAWAARPLRLVTDKG